MEYLVGNFVKIAGGIVVASAIVFDGIVRETWKSLWAPH